MSKRITIMIDDELNQKIRLIQANLIKKENKSISYSYGLNQVLQDSFRINFHYVCYDFDYRVF